VAWFSLTRALTTSSLVRDIGGNPLFFGGSLKVVVGGMIDSYADTYCFLDNFVKKVCELAGYSWIADLEALGIKQNRGSFRKACPGTELLGGGLAQLLSIRGMLA
jgi:hypothetical protein